MLTSKAIKKETNCYENEKVSTYERAARVIDDNRIEFLVKSGEFIVQSDRPNGLSSVVKLKPASFSSMSCSCPATAICFHIIAAQIVLNCSDHSSKTPGNSTTLRKKARKTADKRSGCKKPRLLDVDPLPKVAKVNVLSKADYDQTMELKSHSKPADPNDETNPKNEAIDDFSIVVEEDSLNCTGEEAKFSIKDQEMGPEPIAPFMEENAVIKETFLTTSKFDYWLTDEDMLDAMTLIRKAYPSLGGLQDTVFGATWDFSRPKATPWVQIVHNGKNHWVVAYSKQGRTVSLFDSMGTSGDLDRHVVGCISSLLNTNAKSFGLQRKGCQNQNNGWDCGLFAIAITFSLASNNDPSFIKYDPTAMRAHWKECLQNGKITSFPQLDFSNKSIKMSETVKATREMVHCHCRKTYMVSDVKMPYNVIQCFSCKQWFHRKCENWPSVSDEVLGNVDWVCRNCS